MAMPTSVTVEVEFTAGVWTDVTAYLDGQAGGNTRFGRTSPFGAPSPGSLTLTLANDDGRFMPGRQVLADGVTAHPYYPNVLPRKRIRVAYVVAGVPYYRFTGYIKGWPPSMVNGDTPRVVITATTRDDRLTRVQLLPSLQTELTTQAPRYWWPLTENVGSTAGHEVGGGPSMLPYGTGQAIAFGDSTELVSGDGTSVRFAPTAVSTGQRMVATRLTGSNQWTLSAWVNAGLTAPSWAGASGQNIADFGPGDSSLSQTNWFQLSTTGQPVLGGVNAGAITGPTSIIDGNWHLLTVTADFFGSTIFYVDGVSVGSSTQFSNGGPNWVWLGEIVDSNTGFTAARFQGNISQVSLFARQVSAAEVLTQYNAGAGNAGETVDARIKRILGYAGLTASDWNIDASAVTLGAYQQGSKDAVTACQDATTSEGGGAVFYVGADGKAQFRSRAFRNPATALTLTADAEADLDAGTFQPIFDDTLIVNQVQGSRGTATATASTQVVNDTASQTAYGLTSSSFTSYATTDADVLANAQDQLARQRNPNYQIPQVAVDLSTATTASIYQSVATCDIGDRIRLTNLPPGAAPAAQVDLYIEGWADTFTTDQYVVVFDTSPADAPARAVWENATYGRWQCDGQTLNASLTAAATTVVIASAAGKATFTTNPAMYPLKIQVEQEHIQLNSAPGGAVSPQTFTGVTRGVDGTPAAAQASGATVMLTPACAWSL